MKLDLAHILLEHAYEAEDVLRKLGEGVSFEDLARQLSRCASSKEGGNLGLIDISRLDPVFAEAAMELTPGTQSSVVRTRFGHHIIWRK